LPDASLEILKKWAKSKAMTLQKSCASKHMLRRSSPTPPPLQKPHHPPKRYPFNPFHGSLSPILRSRHESFLEPLYTGGFKAGGCGEGGNGSGDNEENEEDYYVQVRS
jgi:hypothetical protein